MIVRELRFKGEYMPGHMFTKYWLDDVMEHESLTRDLIDSFVLEHKRRRFLWHQNRLLEIKSKGRIIHLANDHNRLVYSLESLISKGAIPPNPVMYTVEAKGHNDWGNHISDDDSCPNEKIKTRPNIPYEVKRDDEKEGIFWHHSGMCCDCTNYVAYLFWYRIVKKMYRLLEKGELTKDTNTIFQSRDRHFYYPKRPGGGRFKEGVQYRNNFIRLTVESPHTQYRGRVIEPELPCISNIDIDHWMNMPDITELQDYRGAVDVYSECCNLVLTHSPLIFIALSSFWAHKDRDKIADVALHLIQQIDRLDAYPMQPMDIYQPAAAIPTITTNFPSNL